MNRQVLDTLSSLWQKYSFQYYTGIIIFIHFVPLFFPWNIYFYEFVDWILAANLNSLKNGF